MSPGDKLSKFLVIEKSKIEMSTVDANTKTLLLELIQDIVRLLDSPND